MSMDQTTFLQILDRYLDGTSSPAETVMVDAWFDGLAVGDQQWEEMKGGQKEDWLAALFQKINENINRQTPIRRLPLYRRGWFRVVAAACIILLVGLGAFLFFQQQK